MRSKTSQTAVPVLLGCLVLAAVCYQSALTPPAPGAPAGNWVVHDVPGTPFAISTPPDFVQRDGGCFHGEATDSIPFGPGWRDFCIWVHPLEDPIPVFVEHTEDACEGCLTYRDVMTTPMTLGRRDVLVQTAEVAAGSTAERFAKEMLIQIPIRSGLALLRAEYGDSDDAAVILGIARTISGERTP